MADKNSTPTSDVHLHVIEYDKDGYVTSYGKPYGSDGDIDPKNNIGYTEPNAVLGYKQEFEQMPSNQIGGSPKETIVKMVGFYDAKNNPIETIKFSDLKSTIDKINQQ